MTWFRIGSPVFAAVLLLLGAGCASQPTAPLQAAGAGAGAGAAQPEVVSREDTEHPPPPPAEPPARPEPVAELPSPRAESIVRPVPPASMNPAVPLSGQASMMVVSQPAGAVVVVDGRPLGHAPLSVNVPVTSRGFMSRQVSVKVRFLAGETARESNTTELVLTPLDRVPVRLDFTPEGARRTLAALQ